MNSTHSWLPILLLTASVSTSLAVPDRLVEALPPEPIAVWMLDARAPASASQPAGASFDVAGFAALLLQRGREMGVLPPLEGTVGWTAEVLSVLPELSPYPRAFVLLDVNAEPLSDGGHRLSGIQAGLILLTGGEHLPVERRIQAVLNLRTNSAHSRLTSREGDGRTWHHLQDDRLPHWAPFEWGAVGDFYVVTVGAGAWERMALAFLPVGADSGGDESKRGQSRLLPEDGESPGQRSLGHDPWFGAAHVRCRGPAARWQWYLDLARLRRRLAPVMPDTVTEVLDGLRLDDVTRGMWTVGPDCRAIDAACVLRVDDRDRYVPITVSGSQAQAFDRVIPPQAHSAAIIHAPPNELVPRFRSAYLSSKSPAQRKRYLQAWADLESELGVKAQADILNHLGEYIIIHDHPKHPLGLALFRTVLIEIGGSSDSVRSAIDRLLSRAQVFLREQRQQRGGFLSALELKHDADGVWYLQMGLYGPALAVTPRWLVISYSPQAVRQNVQYLSGSPAPATAPAAK